MKKDETKLTKEQEQDIIKIFSNLDKKCDIAFESGKMKSMLNELEWINTTFEDVNLSARTVRELEKRRVILMDRLDTSSKKLDELNDEND